MFCFRDSMSGIQERELFKIMVRCVGGCSDEEEAYPTGVEGTPVLRHAHMPAN